MDTLRLCNHCGDAIENFTDRQLLHEYCDRSHTSRCKAAVRDFRQNYSNVDRVLCMGIHVNYLYGKAEPGTRREKDAKRRKRETKISELLKKASALRNTKGGHLLIQLVGLSPRDSFTGAFDEFADEKLNALIDDGAMFSSVYKKIRMATLKGLGQYFDFLVLFVDASSVITTAEFATKIALDVSILNPNPHTMFCFMKRKQLVSENVPAEVPDDLTNAHESRVLQIKGIAKIKLDNDKIVEEVWDKLKLKDCISAFSKSETGGNYLLGIGEKDISLDDYGYQTKVVNIHGLTSEQCTKLEDGLPTKAEESLLLCNFEGEPISQEVITTKRIDTGKDDRHVLLINVKPVHGVVFYESEGPVAYKLERVVTEDSNWEDRVVKASLAEWFHAVLRDSEATPSTGSQQDD